MTRKKPREKAPNLFRRVIRTLDSIQFGVAKEREYLLENISMLAAGGMTVSDALTAVREEIHSRSMRRVLDILSLDLENGLPLWKAFQNSNIFREHTVSLIRIGEETGRLSENLKLIAVQEAKERDFQSKIRSAMLYPVFVLSLTCIVGVLIAWFILPRLATVFAQLDVTLPTITKWLIATGVFLGEYGHIAIPALAVFLSLIIFFTFFYSRTKFIGQSLLFASPGIQGLIREVEVARFGYLLGTLLQAGIPVTQSLDSLGKATTFPHYKKLYLHLHDSIADGNSFQKGLLGYKGSGKLIPIPVQQLIVAGEQSGNLSNTLLTISNNFGAKTEQTTKNISVILEPILLVVVWLGVVAVALAVILPIYSLIGGLNADPSARIQEEASVEDPLPSQRESVSTLRILETGIDYLNVRGEPSTLGEVVSRVFPREQYEYLRLDEGWYEILLSDGSSGWVSGEYVEIIETKAE